MVLRPAKCYRKLKRPYTRVSERKPKKNYVGGVPDSKIKQFEMGDKNADYQLEVHLIAEKGVQIRHNALEAARTNANKYLNQNTDKHFFKILVYPYQVIRENSMATGAGADRLQEGMRRSFGTPVGFAARVQEGQKIAVVRVREGNEAVAREAFRRAYNKLPVTCRVEVERIE